MARSSRSGPRLDLVLFGACVLLSLIATVLPDNLREPVASGLRRSLVAPLIRLQGGAERWRSAYLSAERENLRRDTLALAAARVPALEGENVRLRSLLGLGSKLQTGFIPAEALQGRGRAEDFTVTLSAGSNAGVRERSLVVAPEGLVGLVQTVDPTMSLAILYAHPDFRVSAQSADGTTFGIVQPHVGSATNSRDGGYLASERYLLEMRGVPFRSTLKPGAVIFSTGIGGIYPKGIPIGVVLGELKTTEAWARTYLLRPSVNPTELTSVMILTPERAAGGLTSVWADVGAVDSATRSIVIAGDSLARQSASAEAAARRAALDSAARLIGDTLGRDSTGATRPDSLTRSTPRPPGTPPRPRPDSAAAAAAARARRAAAPPAAGTPAPPRADTLSRDTTTGVRP